MWGSAVASGGSFALTLGAAPPDDALVCAALGVAHLILLPADVAVAEVKVGDKAAFNALMSIAISGASNTAIVYRKPGSDLGKPGWWNQFNGYGCGMGKPKPDDLDDTVPIPCSELTITIDAMTNILFINWT